MSASEVRVSRDALRANFRAVARRAGGVQRVVPVLKANAYGHGTPEVVRALRGTGYRALAVAHASEVPGLRQVHRGRTLVLSAWDTASARTAAGLGAELVVWDAAALRVLARLGTPRRPIRVHLKVDTGTGRLGVRTEGFAELLRRTLREPRVHLAGTFTHFADAEDETDGYTLRQLRSFERVTAGLPRGVERHAACTAAVLRFPTTRLDFVRLGIGLYGIPPSRRAAVPGLRLEPALSWWTRVQQVKEVPSGTPVGYGRTVRTRRRTTLAILPVGYADGYPRALSNTGFVRLSDRHCPVLGRVSMNLTVVDATGTDVRPGTPALLLGGQGRGYPGATAIAQRAGTIPYELTTRIAPTVPRRLTA